MYLDISNEDSLEKARTHVKSVLVGLRGNLQRGAARYNRVSPQTGDAMSLDTDTEESLDVRLCASADGELWFCTGDVQFDAAHGAACGSTTICADDSDDDLTTAAADLVSQVEDQLAFLG